ncbi:MalY/PatB family protein [Aureivirga marina]|uniref:MalY/PatB family protein n=1 Tax=Aureivirga marina TaxID=1182451 RepID=UPI0018C9EB40|nr:PatB family C-S lyase [Aureivirga marina]
MSLIEISDTILNSYFVKNNPKILKEHFGVSDLDSFWIADMDFKIAKPITKELSKIVARENYAYEDVHSEVFHVISQWYKKKQDIDLKQENFIIVNNLLTAISILVKILTKEKESILIQTPVYPPFEQIILSHQRNVLRNPLKIVKNEYEIDFEDLEQKMKREDVRYFLFCNPHNPIGRVWKKEDVEKIYSLAEKYTITVISDEIHSDIIYTKEKFKSFASFSNNKHITLVGSPSKTFGLQGISNGFIYVEEENLHEKIKTFTESLFLNHVNSLSMYATIAAFSKGEEWLQAMLEYVENNYQWIVTFLEKESPEIKVFKLEGTYQIWIDFSDLELKPEDLEETIFRKAKIGLTPGKWYGESYVNFMRMNIGTSLEKIQKVFYRLKKVIELEK